MKNTNFFRMFVLFAVILILSFSSSCKKADESSKKRIEPVKIGYLPITYDLPFFVASKRKLFLKHEIPFEEFRFQNSNSMIDAFMAGRIDVITSASLSAVIPAEATAPGRLKFFLCHFTTESNSSNFLLVSPNSTIDDIKKLRGKTLGIWQGSTMRMYARLIFNQFFDINQNLKIVPLGSRIQLDALKAGRVDALFTIDPIAVLGKNQGIAKILMRGPINKYVLDPLPGTIWAVSSLFLKKNPELTKKIVKSFFEAVDYINENPEQAMQCYNGFITIPIEIANDVLFPDYQKLPEIDVKQIQKFSDLLKREGEIKKFVDIKILLLDEKYLPDQY